MDTSTHANTPESEVSTELRVTGMTCEHCVASVTEELSELDSVTGVAVELKPNGASVVTVQSSAALEADTVRAAITEAGYELVAG